jgi:lipopolysaccharide/colanic/teichoic acid biosynthesis glycosyltransferase
MSRNPVQFWQQQPTSSAALAAAADEAVVATLCETEPRDEPSGVGSAYISPCPAWKRAMDLGGAVVAAIVLLPLFVAIALWIKCVSRGPVLFRQQRYGLDGKPFLLWKFRTIKTNEAPSQHELHVAGLMESDGPLKKIDDELAIIRGGALLRKLGLDELPQLINVLKGEMSLVGPRPDVLPMERYQPWQKDRFHVLPGITGLWQVSGKNHTTFSQMIRLDITYIRQRSVWLDLVILLKTIPALLWS